MNRLEMRRRVDSRQACWDIAIIGGGATGMGIAVDAASRGYEVLLLEGDDFGKGTSSRSTKLVHGGVRYLEQGNLSLVMEALKERGRLRRNAPHLVHDMAFVVPSYDWWESPFYGIGLKVYNILSGKYKFGPSHVLTKEQTLEHLPTLKTEGLRGGVVYYDGQFDDARLLINLASTATAQGATLLNYARVESLTRDESGFINGLRLIDRETEETLSIEAKVVVNATGAFCDTIRAMADPSSPPMIAPSRGIHLVFDRSFLPGETAIMVPHTSDGRVMFAIPWHGKTLVGTTDVPVDSAILEPIASEAEIDFILETAADYLSRPPTRDDILSVFAGIRPLVKAGEAKETAALSRDHTIQIDSSGLITITGGKWTTYRKMAEDCVDRAALLAELPDRTCITSNLNIHGFHEHADRFGNLAVYGSDAPEILDLIRADPSLQTQLDARLPNIEAEVVWAARREMARTVDDVLARRTRMLFLDARAAIAASPRVAELLRVELRKDISWKSAQIDSFRQLAQAYIVS